MGRQVPLVDVIEMAGSLVASGVMSLHDAAVLTMQHGRLTYMGAISLVKSWRTARAQYEGCTNADS